MQLLYLLKYNFSYVEMPHVSDKVIDDNNIISVFA